MLYREKVAFFDFCETLVDFQTADAFCDYVRERTKKTKMFKIEKNIILLKKIYLLPILQKLFRKYGSIEKKLKAYELKGFNYSDLDEYAKKYYESLFGDITKLKESDKDYYALVKKIPHDQLPKMYMCIGTDDFLLATNRKYRDFLLEEKVDLTYEEGPGNHEWDFWDRYILKILDWLPLNKKDEGLNSGHVSK